MKEHNYNLQNDHIELIKLLKDTKLCGSGGEAQHYVEQGIVRRNGEVEIRKRCKLTKGDTIEFFNNKICIK